MIDKLLTSAIVAAIVFVAGIAVGFIWQKGKYDDKLRDAQHIAFEQREVQAAAWAENLAAVLGRAGSAEGRAAALDRCIASGRCSRDLRHRMLQHCPAPASAAPVADAARPEPVPAGPGEAADDGQDPIAGLIQDCAVTTAQLNELQRAIEAQPGY